MIRQRPAPEESRQQPLSATAIAAAIASARDLIAHDQPRVAEEPLRSVLRANPDHVEALHLLAMLLLGRGRADLAINLLRRAIAVEPGGARYHEALGHALREAGYTRDALTAFRTASDIAPSPGLDANMALLLPVIPESGDDIHFWRERMVRELAALLQRDSFQLENPLEQVGHTAFHLAYHGLSDRSIQETIARFYLQASPDLAWVAPRLRAGERSPRGDSRINVGFVSTYFRHHTITKVTRGLIRDLSRDRFRVTVFHLGPEDAWTREVVESADRSVKLTPPLPAMRDAIADEDLDVLFYPDIGMHPATYFLAFSRLAPVQCVTWGHPVTTGIPNVDYYLSSEVLEPPGSEREYSERLHTLRALPTSYARPVPPVDAVGREWFGLPADRTLYVLPQLIFKLHPRFDDVLAEILRRDPAGLVVLVEGERGVDSPRKQLFLRRFGRHHGDVIDRLVVLPFLDGDRFLDLLAVADVLLDPAWFGGGNTSMEAFAIGTPIITWPGPFARGRVTAACYALMSIEDGVVPSLDAYAERAVAIAHDPAWREAIRQRILARSHVLYDNMEAVREFERFFETAVQTARERRA